MHWIRSHRYTLALIAAAVLVVIGGVVAKNNIGTGLESGGVENVSVEYPYYAPPVAEYKGPTATDEQSPQNPIQNTSSAPFAFRFGNTKPKETPAVQATPPIVTRSAQSEPVKIPGPPPPNDGYVSFFQALSRILSPADTRTPEQKALHDYGNTLGSIIRNFENTHTGVVQTLKTFFDSRTDPSKAAGIPKIAGAYAQLTAARLGIIPSGSSADATANLQTVANEYVQLSTTIASLQNIPPEAETLNSSLIKGYANVAQGLSKLTKAENDAQLLEAINAYNANADEFIRNYVALVHLFSAYGVKFSASDPGAIFSFDTAGSL